MSDEATSSGLLSDADAPRKVRPRLFDPLGILMDDDLRIWIGGMQPRLNLVGDLMRPDQAQPPIHLDVELDKGGRPSDAGAQIMSGGHVGVRLRDRADSLALVV